MPSLEMVNRFSESQSKPSYPRARPFDAASAYWEEASPVSRMKGNEPPYNSYLRKKTPKRWRPEEDAQLRALVDAFGAPAPGTEWTVIARQIPGRSSKQCRDRWNNHLAPDIKHDAWTQTEDELLLQLQRQLGNAWSSMLPQFPGRSYASLKNRFGVCDSLFRWYGTLRFVVKDRKAAERNFVQPSPEVSSDPDQL